MVSLKIFVVFVLLYSGCTYPDPTFFLQRKNLVGNDLRVDGYYIQKRFNDQKPIYVLYFFYRNGVLFRPGSAPSFEELDSYATFLSNPKNNQSNQNSDGWGVFDISNTNIELEIMIQEKKPPLKTYLFNGTVLDSTHFIITEELSGYTGKRRVLNDTFYFRPLAVKPDSTNRYIK